MRSPSHFTKYKVMGSAKTKQHCVYRAFKLCLIECIPTIPMPFPTLITKYTKVQVTKRTDESSPACRGIGVARSFGAEKLLRKKSGWNGYGVLSST